MLGNPTACPHGNQIPGSKHQSVILTPLNTIKVGDSFIIVRISEELEETAGVLDILETNEMFPGRQGVITSREKDGETSLLMSESASPNSTVVSSFIGSRLLVTSRK